MKRILLPTDRSKNAEHAMNYAFKLFEDEQIEFILFQSVEIPIYSTDMPVPMMFDATEEIKENLKTAASKLQEKYTETGFRFSALVESGSLSFNVEQLIEAEAIDLIVMGTKGASGLTGAIIGTNTADVISIAKCPVLMVPEFAEISIPKDVLFATDNKGFANDNVLRPFISLVERFRSHVHLMNVLDEGDLTSVEEAVEGLKLDHLLENVHHTFHFLYSDDKVSSIENYASAQNIDMLVVIPRHNDFFSSVFHRSVTRKLALHSKVPLLALCDRVS